MKLKKILSLLLILCMIVTLAACSGKASRDDDEDEDEKTVSSSKDKGNLFSKGSDAKDKDDDEEDEDSIGGLFGRGSSYDDKDDSYDDDWFDSDDDEDDSDPYDTYQSVDLPKGFPSRDIPVYKDGQVIYAQKDKDGNGQVYYYILQYCNDPSDEVLDYYTRLLEDADEFKSQGALGNYALEGELKDYRFAIFIAEDANNKNKCNITMEIIEKN